jgi:hypothetical protein
MKTKDVVMYVRNVSLMKFTKPVSTLAPRPANEITHYRPSKKEIVPVTKSSANADASADDADNDAETYRYYLL